MTGPEDRPAEPPSHFGLAFLALLLCTFAGTIALVYACQVGTEWRIGNHWIAQDYSRRARGWAIAGITIGLALIAVLFIVLFVVLLAYA